MGIVYSRTEDHWSDFKSKYNKSFASLEEDTFRKVIFLKNTVLIAKHNELYRSGLSTFSLEMNSFGDLLQSEFIDKVNGFNYRLVTSIKNYPFGDASTFDLPTNSKVEKSIDWRQNGYVTPVKDQGSCRSCWAFSATGSLEGQHFRKNGTLISFSEQNLIDCSRMYGNMGCNGGMMNLAFKYIKTNKGLDTENSYPYKAKDDKCQYNPKSSSVRDMGFVNIPDNENSLMNAVGTIGPVSAAIDASSSKFQFYKNGVYYNFQCSSTLLDHAVLIVGYGNDSKHGDYWIVKNSWGTQWGKDGYVLMARNKKNNCGIATSASYPVVV
ncbi:Cathepsin propeptide inhibitor domain (I29),Cysteine peptidase, asparagine active site,Cysteine [Cinara cedri]|uniref:Cathepsin propeptide inhibitor domain (I29),Cysteine peptidase, asparagine active site,Cysteine n=1 Tax=Cinara cedri TaxID=506608 RepID=A0A5E4MV13_9HEMI|nr:Cathepsin propeptide inhibitor domain (I29),Cysteine peptidase, asparagine active site,Cysteine [Cinara cedri]